MKKLLFLLGLVSMLSIPSFAQATTVTVSNASGSPGQQNIPVNINLSSTAAGITGIDLTLQYDANILQVLDAKIGTLTSGWTFVTNTATAGTVKITAFNTTALSTSAGSIAIVDFNVTSTATANSTSSLQLSSAKFNEKNADSVVNGTFTVVKGANHAPVLDPIGNKSVVAGSGLIFNITASDQDNDTLTYSASGLPSGATFNSTSHAFNWTPGYNQVGNYTTTFTVSDGTVPVSQTITITVSQETTPPSVPAGLTATVISTTQINLSWTASTDNAGVTGYNIYRGGTKIATSATNSYQNTGLTPNTSYTYTVSAYDAAGNTSSQSASRSATTQALPTYTLTITAANGSVTKNPNQTTYDAGTVVTLTAAPNSGYGFASWSGDITGTTNPATITMSANRAVTANFSVNTFTITASSGTGGTISPTGAVSVSSGASKLFTITANSGYSINQILIDGVNNAAAVTAGSYTFSSVSANHTIAASFTLIPATVNATVASASGYAAQQGIPVNISVNDLSSLAIKGIDLVLTYNSTILSVPSDGVVLGTLDSGWSLTANTATAGQVSISLFSTTALPAQAGSIAQIKFNVAASAASGATSALHLSTAKFNEKAAGTVTDGTFTVSKETTAPSVPTGLTASAASSSKINLSWTASTDNVAVTGYTIYRAGVNIATSTTNSYQDTGLTANTTYAYTVAAYDAAGNASAQSTSASAKTLATYTLTITAANGSVTKNPNQTTYDAGTVVTLTAAPNSGYGFASWSGDLTGTTNPATITMSANRAVTANFSVNTFTITASSGTGGTISPTGAVSVSSGASKLFTITANSGYSINQILIDGVNNAAAVTAGSYTFSSVSANHTIAASFTLIPATVNATVASASGYAAQQGIPVNISVNDLSSLAIKGIDLVLTYNSTILSVPSDGVVLGTLDSGWSLTANTATAGQVSISLFSTTALPAQAGSIAQIKFNVAASAASGATSALHLSTAKFNEKAAGTVTDGTFTVSKETTAPSVPTGLTASAASSSKINLSWTASTDNVAVTGYTIYRAGVNIATSTTNSYQDTGLTANTTYAYTVAAYDAAGNASAQSTSASAKTLATYTLTITAANGSVTKNPNQTTYDAGTVVTLTAAPNSGYGFASWSGDLTGTTNPATITMSANRAVTANFSVNTFTITASSGTGGTISPTGAVSVSSGASKLFTITANSGYSINQILIDGVNNAAAVTAGSYTFSSVSANHTIAASFTLIPATVNATVASASGYAAQQGIPVNISVNDLSSLAIKGIDLVLTYNSTILSVPSDGVVLGTLDSGWSLTANTATAGQVSISLFSTTALPAQAGSIAQIKFNVAASAASGATSALHLSTAKFNEKAAGTVTDGTFTVSKETTAPSVPTGLTASAASSSKINLSWTASTDNVAVTGYTIYRAGVNIATSTTNSYQDTGLTANTTYAYTVAAYDAAGNASAQSTSASAKTLATYTLTITAANGSVTKNPNQTTYDAGTVVTLTAAPNSGYGFASWSGDITGTTNPATITMSANRAVTANFSVNTFTITASSGTGGTISPTGAVSVSSGASKLFTITANSGYSINQILIDGVNNAAAVTAGSYTFSSVSANHTIAASFTLIPATVNATVASASGYAAQQGIPVNISVNDLSSLAIKGIDLVLTYNSTILSVPSDGVVLGTLDSGWSLTANTATAGQVSISLFSTTALPAQAGSIAQIKFNVAASAASGATSALHLSTAKFNEKAAGTVTDGTFTVSKETTAPSVPTGLTASAASSSKINLSWTASTDNVAVTGYTIYRAGVNIATSTTNSYQDTGLTANTTYAYTVAAYDAAGNASAQSTSASAKTLATYTLTITAANGSVTKNPNQTTYDAGTVVTLTAAPNSGYGFASWSGDITGTTNPATITMSANRAVTANFSVNTFTITASSGTGGTISPTGAVSVSSGASKLFTITANSGYSINQILIDGVNNAAAVTAGSYTFSSVSANHTIAASFTLIPATVNATVASASGYAAQQGIPVNISVNDLSSLAIKGIDLVLTYNSTILSVPSDGVVLGTLDSGWSLTANTATAGQVSISLFSTTALPAQAGSIAQIKFNVAASAASGATSALHLSTAKFNEKAAGTVTDGTFTVSKETTAPSVPTGLTASAASSSKINLSWTASTDNVAVTGYTIYRAGVNIATSTTNSYQDTGLTANTTYAYTVAAYDAAGNASAQSTSASAKTLATYTLTITAANGSVTKNPNQTTYDAGTVVTLTAAPNSGYGFASWSGDLTGTTNPATITMSANRAVTANFYLITKVNVTVQSASGYPTQLAIPVNISVNDLSNLAIKGINLVLAYDSKLLSVPLDGVTLGTIDSSWSLTANTNIAGQVNISLFSTAALPAQTGSIAQIKFNVAASAAVGVTSSLHLSTASFNEKPADTVSDGIFTVIAEPNDPPKFVSSLPIDGSIVNALDNLVIKLSDDKDADEVATGVTVTKDGAAFAKFTRDNSVANQITLHFTAQEDGVYAFTIVPVDNKGLKGNQATVKITLDSTAPLGSVVINNGNSYTPNTSVSLTISAKDALSGLDKMLLSNDNNFSNSWESYSALKAWTISSGDGEKTVYIKFKDKAGNESSVYSSKIILDSTAPVNPGVTQVQPTVSYKGGLYTKSSIVTIDGTKEKGASIIINGKEMVPLNDETTWECKYTLLDKVTDFKTANDLSIQSTDAAGNKSGSTSLNVIYKPRCKINIISPKNYYIRNSDMLAGARELAIMYSVDDDSEMKVKKAVLSADNTIYEEIAEQDFLGNTGEATAKYILDTDGPKIAIASSVPSQPVSSSSVTLEGTVDDAASGVDYIKINGVKASISGDKFSVLLNLAEGNNPVTIEASDNSGNITTKSLTLQYEPANISSSAVSGTTASSGSSNDNNATPVVVGGYPGMTIIDLGSNTGNKVSQTATNEGKSLNRPTPSQVEPERSYSNAPAYSTPQYTPVPDVETRQMENTPRQNLVQLPSDPASRQIYAGGEREPVVSGSEKTMHQTAIIDVPEQVQNEEKEEAIFSVKVTKVKSFLNLWKVYKLELEGDIKPAYWQLANGQKLPNGLKLNSKQGTIYGVALDSKKIELNLVVTGKDKSSVKANCIFEPK